MALLDWARPRRWSILGEAVLAAAVALAAWPILAVANNAPAPVDVVRDYLEALRDGDVDRAESFVSDTLALDADRSWLTAEAMSSDWKIESVELKSASETTVHAVISSGERRAEGAFHLEGFDDDLLIADPYMYLSVTSPLFSSIEIGGVRGEVDFVEGGTRPVALYPGSYSLFESTPEFAGEDGLSLLALPGSDVGTYSLDTLDLNALMTDVITGSDAIESRLNDDLAAWIDDCAESADIAPAGCPFSAANGYGVAYDGDTEFEAVTELDWAVESYPKVRFGRDLRLEVVELGWVTLSGKGTPLFGDGEAALDGRCGVEVEELVPVIGDDGSITLAPAADQWNTCY